MDNILRLLKEKEIWKHGDYVIYLAKGKYELVDGFKARWKKIKMIMIMNINNIRINKKRKNKQWQI